MDGQREFVSAHASSTDIVTQIFVPTGGNFGVLIPVPAQPTIDPNPVPAADLDALDQATRPQITVVTPSGSGGGEGCGCVPMRGVGGTASGTPISTGVRSGPAVTVGPVTATPLTASDATALNGWLSQNGFAVSAAGQGVVDSYVGPGQWFVALTRAAGSDGGTGEGGAPDGGVSVGVHFSVQVVHEEMELKMASLGAGSSMAFTVFVAAPSPVGPTNAAALTLNDLDGGLLVQSYAQAVSAAVTGNGGKAWVVEGDYGGGVAGGALAALVDPTQTTLTRLTTIVTPDQMTYDAVFGPPGPSGVVNARIVTSPGNAAAFPFGGRGDGEGDSPGGEGGASTGTGLGFGLLLFVGALFVRRRWLRPA